MLLILFVVCCGKTSLQGIASGEDEMGCCSGPKKTSRWKEVSLFAVTPTDHVPGPKSRKKGKKDVNNNGNGNRNRNRNRKERQI